MSSPKVSLFCVSFRRDAKFFANLVASYRKFCTGFHEFVVAVPHGDEHLFQYDGIRCVIYVDDPRKPFLAHQVMKMCADVHCTGDYIMHVDSDCLFWTPCTPEFYFKDGKPILYRERFDTLTNKMRLHWRDAVRNALGMDCEYDYMVRHSAVHLRQTHLVACRIIEAVHNKSVREYVLSCKNEFPQSFAEFPTLGAVAASHFPDRYHFVDFDVRTPDGGYPYDKSRDALVAFWSHGGVDRYAAETAAILNS